MKPIYLTIRVCFVFLIAFQLSSYAQNINRPETPGIDVTESLEKLKTDYPHQKVYLNTDKASYLAGDHIWYSAYVINAVDHHPDESGTNLHVELTDHRSRFISISLVQIQDGYSYGDIHLPDSLPEGNYYLRAYTEWMRNFDEKFYYQQEIYVNNPIEENFIRRRDIRTKRRFNQTLKNKQNKMQFAVFPEGGDIVNNLNNRVAFKATDALGAGQKASGKVLDSDGNPVLEFETYHDGMGVFEFTPKTGENYSAKVHFDNGKKLTYQFTESLNYGYLLRADAINDKINIKVESNFSPEDHDIKPEITVIAHTRGRRIFADKAELKNRIWQTSVSKDLFPTGICHITVFDANMLPVSERLVFVNHDDISQVHFKNLKYENSDKLELLFAGYSEDKDIYGSYSMSVLYPSGKDVQHESNIASYFLLESDLGSTFLDPWYYLSGDDEEIRKALDLLMMTHGWRRFDWENVLAGTYPEINYEHAIGLTISGRLLTLRDSRPLNNVPVELSIDQNGSDIYSTETSTGGVFSFQGLHYEGEFNATLVPGTTHHIPTVDLDIRKYDKTDFSMSFLTRTLEVLERGDKWSRQPSSDVTVKPYIKPDFKKDRTKSSYGNPDQIIYIDELPSGYSTLRSALRGRLISLGAEGSFMASTEPLYMIDGNPTNSVTFNNLNPQNVEKVEVFRGASTTVFGARGANGVIIAYTRTSFIGEKPYFEFEYPGYDKPGEFYRSRIKTEYFKQSGINKTFFWIPQIIPDQDGRATVELSEKIKTNDYIIIIEGIDNKGRISFSKKTRQTP